MTFGRKETDGAWLFTSFILKEVSIMSDFEMLSIFIMILMLIFAVLDYSKKSDK